MKRILIFLLCYIVGFVSLAGVKVSPVITAVMHDL